MTADWVYDYMPNWWTHPETGIVILHEDMPWELKPETA